MQTDVATLVTIHKRDAVPTADLKPARPGPLGLVLLAQRVLAVLQAVVAAALLVAIGIVLAGVAPTLAGAESYTVYSGSMEPAIRIGSLAVVRAARSSELQPGDIITYRTPIQPDVVVTHRLMSVVALGDGRYQYRTKGDANQVEDLVQVEPNAVLGKVIYTVPYAGYIADFSRTAHGRLILVGLPAVFLLLDFLRERIRRRARREAAARLQQAAAGGDIEAEQLRLATLLDRARQALVAGEVDLAVRAVDGVLAADPRNEEAWLLKARLTPDPASRRQLLQTAVLLNPGSDRMRALLEPGGADRAGSSGASHGVIAGQPAADGRSGGRDAGAA